MNGMRGVLDWAQWAGLANENDRRRTDFDSSTFRTLAQAYDSHSWKRGLLLGADGVLMAFDVATFGPSGEGAAARSALHEVVNREVRQEVEEKIARTAMEFPSFRVGDSVTKTLPDGTYPRWFSANAAEKMGTIQGRYWMNRAAAAAPGEFTARQLAKMRAGFAPQARVLVRNSAGEIETRTISKELHHALGNRGTSPFDEPINIREVWPWQHESIDAYRHIGYEFLNFLDWSWVMNLDDVYENLLPIVSQIGAQIDVPIESEQFFEKQAAEFLGEPDEFIEFVRMNLKKWFRIVNERPRWLQEAEWQFDGGVPMTFVGQIDIPKSAGLYHDDAALFVFVSPTGVSKTLIQVAWHANQTTWRDRRSRRSLTQHGKKRKGSLAVKFS
jgi:hypothetical protein